MKLRVSKLCSFKLLFSKLLVLKLLSFKLVSSKLSAAKLLCGKVCKAGRSSSERSGVNVVRSSCASSVGKAGLLKLLSAKLAAVSKLSS